MQRMQKKADVSSHKWKQIPMTNLLNKKEQIENRWIKEKQGSWPKQKLFFMELADEISEHTGVAKKKVHKKLLHEETECKSHGRV